MELHISSFDLFSRKQHWFLSRRGYTTRSLTTAFRLYEKLYTFREDMSAELLTGSDIDFELEIFNLKNGSATVYNKLPRHSKLKDRNIVQHSKESTWMIMKITLFAPEEFFFEDQIRGKIYAVSKKTENLYSLCMSETIN